MADVFNLTFHYVYSIEGYGFIIPKSLNFGKINFKHCEFQTIYLMNTNQRIFLESLKKTMPHLMRASPLGLKMMC